MIKKSLKSNILFPSVIIIILLVIIMTAYSSLEFYKFTSSLANENIAVAARYAQAARELLEKLEPMLKMGNPECRDHINSLRGIAGSGELIKQIEDFEFESALSSLEEIKKKL